MVGVVVEIGIEGVVICVDGEGEIGVVILVLFFLDFVDFDVVVVWCFGEEVIDWCFGVGVFEGFVDDVDVVG